MLIDLISNNECIILFGKVSYYFQLVICKYLAAWIGRITEYNSLRVLFEGSFQYICIKAELRRNKRNVNRLSSRKNCICAAILIERREYDDLIPRICDRHHSRHHSFCTSAGNDYLTIRVYMSSHKSGLFFSKSLTEILSPPCN